jgi:hypothetical protein
MNYAAAQECSWALERTSGALRGGTLAGCVDVSHPDLGLRNVQLGERHLTGHFFCVHRDAVGSKDWPLSVAEAYVRGTDLVASYQPSADWPYSPQIYWRANAIDSFEGVLGSLSLLVSVQTHLLDTHPKIVVTSQLAAKEVLHVTPDGGKCVKADSIARDCTIQPAMGICCLVHRLTGTPISYAEFMPASDYQSLQVRNDDNGNWNVQWTLFAEFLEKGVIRRARLHGAFLRRENDLDLAAACCEAIERDSLPLTT